MHNRDLRKKYQKRKQISFSRRTFIFLNAITISCNRFLKPKKNTLNTNQTQTIDALTKHLFSGNEGPSSKDINAANYLTLRLTSENTKQYKKNRIYSGLDLVNIESQKAHNKLFVELSFEQKENLLINISKSKQGKKFLSLCINYIFEALLADPVYEAQPNSVGWRWLEHKAGFPRPKKADIRV